MVSITTKVAVFLAGLAILMAVPMVMLLQLGISSWDIWYLNVIPLWVIGGMAWVLRRTKLLAMAKWVVWWYLGYWLFYDWTWWTIAAGVDPGAFSLSAEFYFDIIVHRPHMWFFLTIAVLGFALGLVLLLNKQRLTWGKLLPYIMYLVYVYGLGSVALHVALSPSVYIGWSVCWVPVLVVAFAKSWRLI